MPRKKYVPTPEPKASPYGIGTLADLLHAYELSSDYRALSPATKTTRRIHLRYLTKFHDVPAEELERDVLLELADAIHVKSGPGAANGFLTATSTVFNWAIERGKFKSRNPLFRAKKFKSKRLPTFGAELCDRAEQLLPEPLRRVLVLGRYIGQRRGDLIRLTWDCYDGTTLRFQQQKQKHYDEPVQMELLVHPDLKAELDAWKAEASGTNVVPLHGDPLAGRTILRNFEGGPWQPEALSRRMKFQLEKVGLRKKGQRGVNIHGLRKLVAVSLAEAGASVKEIQGVTGHRTLAMVQLYTADADLKRLGDAAIMKLPGRKGGQ